VPRHLVVETHLESALFAFYLLVKVSGWSCIELATRTTIGIKTPAEVWLVGERFHEKEFLIPGMGLFSISQCWGEGAYCSTVLASTSRITSSYKKCLLHCGQESLSHAAYPSLSSIEEICSAVHALQTSKL
jgi:hypothetical protein